MQFEVPQFLDVEDKIFGPLTLKQFLYLAGAGGFSFILFFALQTWLWITCTSVLAVIAAGLAFGKFNGRPIIYTLFSVIKYTWRPKFYLWQYSAPGQEQPVMHSIEGRQPTGSALKKLLLRLTTRQ